MTVAELIESLKKVDQSLTVVAYGQLGDDGGHIHGIDSKEIADLVWNPIISYEITNLNDCGHDVVSLLLRTK
jgi:hypothetical protein